jgi:hypothetical protein
MYVIIKVTDCHFVCIILCMDGWMVDPNNRSKSQEGRDRFGRDKT